MEKSRKGGVMGFIFDMLALLDKVELGSHDLKLLAMLQGDVLVA